MTANMNNKKGSPVWLKLLKLKTYAALAVIVLVIVAVAVIAHRCSGDDIHTEVSEDIGLTPTQILSMHEIGQWEFLSVEDEELVDTVHKGFFSEKTLTRIYYGTLRLGFDMRSVKEGWLTRTADTLTVTLPPITLLDKDFIDETRTKAFYETGTWTDADRKALYERARAKMLRRCLTAANIKSAEQNASRQVSQMFKSLGFAQVRIRFEQPADKR